MEDLEGASNPELKYEAINRLYRLKDYRERVFRNTLDWPFIEVVKLADQRLGEPDGEGIYEVMYRRWERSVDSARHGFEQLKFGDVVLVRHCVSENLVNSVTSRSGSLYLDERIAGKAIEYNDGDLCHCKLFRTMYEVLIEIDAIERYPGKYRSRVADFLEGRTGRLL